MTDNIREIIKQHRIDANGATFKLLRDDLLEAYKQDERDFSLANLYEANLSGADLSGANLSGANLSGADLYRANLREANLSGANLSGADLSGANLYRANLSGADLSGADLSGANLYRANLYGADLRGADLREADFIASIGGVGSSRRTIWAYRRKEDKVIIVSAGCREEPAKDVIAAIHRDYGKTSVQGKAYVKAVKLIAELVELQYADEESVE